MGEVEGKEWDYVTTKEDGDEKEWLCCKMCVHEFTGGAWRIRQHNMHSSLAPGSQVLGFAAKDLEPVLKEVTSKCWRPQNKLGQPSSAPRDGGFWNI